MMALHWYPERRHRLEDPLLCHYHEALVDAGVRGYGLDALCHDYRHAVVRQLGVPVFQHSAKLPAAIWGAVSSASSWPSTISGAKSCL